MGNDNGQRLPIGTRLNSGHYIVNKVLGQGGFGITYLAHDTALDKAVAIKEFFPYGFVKRNLNNLFLHPMDDQGREIFEYGLDRYIEEARALAKFSNHAGVVDVTYFFRENNTAYMVMDYLKGETICRRSCIMAVKSGYNNHSSCRRVFTRVVGFVSLG